MHFSLQKNSSPAPLTTALTALERIVLGKPEKIRLALVCLLAEGHLLIEDIPGVGKTTLARALAQVLGLGFQRIQFTSDLLPADIIGVTVFEREHERFSFRPGPLFAQVVLADEVNRATPRAQSALLEAMQERQASVDGISHPLPRPFFVIATQNPQEQIGTYPLPESQLDRFAMRLSLGYPQPAAERALYAAEDRRHLLERLEPTLTAEDVIALQARVGKITMAPALLDYVQALVGWTRDCERYHHGLSPRAGLSLVRLARAHALLEGRNAALPEDVQAVLPAAVNHRLEARRDERSGEEIARELIEAVAIP
ncbi:MAG TPA: MoxR family ATPase [Gammaproteobacteria bacterium]|nr:MoxR family ATPase [Gammaproteobacteria bacterium]